jgi:hypothetical protein
VRPPRAAPFRRAGAAARPDVDRGRPAGVQDALF